MLGQLRELSPVEVVAVAACVVVMLVCHPTWRAPVKAAAVGVALILAVAVLAV